MNTMSMKWLIRREFWENKGSMFWAQAIFAALLVLLVGGSIVYGLAHGGPGHIEVSGRTVHRVGFASAMTPETREKVASVASAGYIGGGAPLLMLMTASVFFYCLGALYDERRDRSILFWKSLPVSDGQTVLSKVLVALCVAPLISMALGVIASLLMLFMGMGALSASGVNLFPRLLSSPDLYLQPLRLFALLPVYMVWALPTVGWLLLVSSWAKSKPILWAVGVPLMCLVLLKWISVAAGNFMGEALDVQWFANNIVGRGIGGLVPGIWFPFTGGIPPELHPTNQGIDMQGLFNASWATLATAKAWIGAAIGAAMIFGATRLRRWRDEG